MEEIKVSDQVLLSKEQREALIFFLLKSKREFSDHVSNSLNVGISRAENFCDDITERLQGQPSGDEEDFITEVEET